MQCAIPVALMYPNFSHRFSLKKLKKFQARSTRPCTPLNIQLPSPPEFRHFCFESHADNVKLVKTCKRISSPADPIHVLLLCSISDCIGLSTTPATNSSLLSGVFSSALYAAIVRPILNKVGCDCDGAPPVVLLHHLMTRDPRPLCGRLCLPQGGLSQRPLPR